VRCFEGTARPAKRKREFSPIGELSLQTATKLDACGERGSAAPCAEKNARAAPESKIVRLTEQKEIPLQKPMEGSVRRG